MTLGAYTRKREHFKQNKQKSFHIVSHNGCLHLQSYQQYAGSIFPHPCQRLLFLVFFDNSHSYWGKQLCIWIGCLLHKSTQMINKEHIY